MADLNWIDELKAKAAANNEKQKKVMFESINHHDEEQQKQNEKLSKLLNKNAEASRIRKENEKRESIEYERQKAMGKVEHEFSVLGLKTEKEMKQEASLKAMLRELNKNTQK